MSVLPPRFAPAVVRTFDGCVAIDISGVTADGERHAARGSLVPLAGIRGEFLRLAAWCWRRHEVAEIARDWPVLDPLVESDEPTKEDLAALAALEESWRRRR